MGFALLFQRVQHVNTLAECHGEQKKTESGGELNWRAMYQQITRSQGSTPITCFIQLSSTSCF